MMQVKEPSNENSRTNITNIVQKMENVSNFLLALEGLNFPKNATFSIADIESDSWDERYTPVAVSNFAGQKDQ